MPESPVKTETMKASDVRQRWSEVVNAVFRERKRIVVEKSGITVGAIVSAQDLARLEALDKKRAEQDALFERMSAAFADVPEDEILENAVRIVHEVRAQMRAEQIGEATSR